MQLKGLGLQITQRIQPLFLVPIGRFFNSTYNRWNSSTCNEKTVEEPSASSYTITGGSPEFRPLSKRKNG